MSDPVETSELLAFVRTADARSLARAARELGVPRATISRRLARLEERLGVRLLTRTTRSLALTDAGEAFYGSARLVLDAVTQAEDTVRRTDDEIRGPLRVSVPPIQDVDWYGMLADFAAAHPNVEMQVHFSTQFVDLTRDGFHVALRAGTTLEPGLVARTLARAKVVAVASPDYLERNGVPRTVKDLKNHRCLVGFARGETPETHWPLLDGGQVHVKGSFHSNDPNLLCVAAQRGLGIALLPAQIAAPPAKKGLLVGVLHDVIGAESRFSLVYAEKQFVPPQVRAFIDTVAAWVPGRLDEDIVAECASIEARAKAGIRTAAETALQTSAAAG